MHPPVGCIPGKRRSCGIRSRTWHLHGRGLESLVTRGRLSTGKPERRSLATGSYFRLHVGRMACRKTREIQESNQNGRRFSAFHQQISDVELAVFSVTRSGVLCRERNANFTTTQEEEIDSRSLEPKRNQSHPHSSATNGDG